MKKAYTQLPLISAQNSDSAATPHLIQPKYALGRGKKPPTYCEEPYLLLQTTNQRTALSSLKTEPVRKQSTQLNYCLLLIGLHIKFTQAEEWRCRPLDWFFSSV